MAMLYSESYCKSLRARNGVVRGRRPLGNRGLCLHWLLTSSPQPSNTCRDHSLPLVFPCVVVAFRSYSGVTCFRSIRWVHSSPLFWLIWLPLGILEISWLLLWWLISNFVYWLTNVCQLFKQMLPWMLQNSTGITFCCFGYRFGNIELVQIGQRIPCSS